MNSGLLLDSICDVVLTGCECFKSKVSSLGCSVPVFIPRKFTVCGSSSSYPFRLADRLPSPPFSLSPHFLLRDVFPNLLFCLDFTFPFRSFFLFSLFPNLLWLLHAFICSYKVSMHPIVIVINLAAKVFIFRLRFFFSLLVSSSVVKNHTPADLRVRSTLANSIYV